MVPGQLIISVIHTLMQSHRLDRCIQGSHCKTNDPMCRAILAENDGELMQAHGWTLRGDDQDAKVGDAAKDAFARALKWFQQHL